MGWELLESRRKRKKLISMYKIDNGYAPDYLTDFLPPQVGSQLPYCLRNLNDTRIPLSRVELHENSFYPSTLKMWNSLDDNPQ